MVIVMRRIVVVFAIILFMGISLILGFDRQDEGHIQGPVLTGNTVRAMSWVNSTNSVVGIDIDEPENPFIHIDSDKRIVQRFGFPHAGRPYFVTDSHQAMPGIALFSDGQRKVARALHFMNGEVQIGDEIISRKYLSLSLICPKRKIFAMPELAENNERLRLAKFEQETLQYVGIISSPPELYADYSYYHAAMSPDGSELAVPNLNRDHILIFDVATGIRKRSFGIPEKGLRKFTGVAYAPNSAHMVTTTISGIVALWNAQTGEFVRQVAKLPGSTDFQVRFLNNGKLLFIGCAFGEPKRRSVLRFYDTTTFHEVLDVVKLFPAETTAETTLHSYALAEDGSRLAVCDGMGRIYFWYAPQTDERFGH